ncbi:MAG: TMEM43 family protein [Rhodanobacter sp.]|jgi:hypothetical protein
MDLRKGLSMHALALNVIGAVLMLAGIALLAITARGLLDYRKAASRHGGEVIELGRDAQPVAGQHGYMARLVGVPNVVEAPHDPDFNQHANTPVLERQVEMFQWREVRIGSSVHYEQDWVDHVEDSSRFQNPRGHTNPAALPIESQQFVAGLVQIGGFKLGPQLVLALPGSQLATPDPASLPANLAASFSLYGNYLVTSQQPAYPRLGDVRVSWEEVPLQQVTVIGRLDGDRLVAAADAGDGKGYSVQVGDVSLLDIFPDLPEPPEFVTGSWILSVLLAALGAFVLLFAKRRRMEPLLAMGLGGLLVGTIASVLWIGAGGTTLSGWLAVAVLGLLLTGWRLHRPH